MRSGITRRWLRGSLLITVLLVLLAETMFLYNYTRSYYNSVQQTMYRRFSSVSGQLKMYTGDTVQSTAATRSVALRRMVEQFADKDKYEFMLLDSYGGVIASSSGTNADGIVTGIDFEQAQEASDGLGVAVYRTQSGELVMAACYLVPYAAEDVAAMRLVTSLTLVGAQIKNALAVSVVIAAVILAFTVMSGLYFIRSIVVPLGQVERIAADIARVAHLVHQAQHFGLLEGLALLCVLQEFVECHLSSFGFVSLRGRVPHCFCRVLRRLSVVVSLLVPGDPASCGTCYKNTRKNGSPDYPDSGFCYPYSGSPTRSDRRNLLQKDRFRP